MNKTYDFDVLVIGGGHAGIEAAYAAAKMGSKTALVTLKLDSIGLMPCNPAVGGVGKGHMVYELSAMGGLMPKLCTSTYIQVRMLNTSKGPAVQGLRLQIDKEKYRKLAHTTLEQVKNLTLIEAAADDIIVDPCVSSQASHEASQGTAGRTDCEVQGIITQDGRTITAPCVILTTGTFLNGRTFIGKVMADEGRRQEPSVKGLSKFLQRMELQMGRLKTGTPPRLLASSIDTSVMEYQEPEQLEYLFEFAPHKSNSTHPCYITHTNQKTHAIIKNNLHQSPLYSGHITGKAPRYCPSIEDKIGRFPDKISHHVFVEPEGADHPDIYPNGISTSLPLEVQQEYIRSIKGFENAIIAKAGYAVEYDYVAPNQLHETMELKKVPGLFLAGQINGTTGYEEAAAQGLVAGINASLKAKKLLPFTLDRTESYIGVMINDLTSMGVDEPYRMFTSRAERRLILRQDNAFLRLTDKAYNLGLIDAAMYAAFVAEKEAIADTLAQLRKKYKAPDLMHRYGQNPCTVDELFNETGNRLSARAALTVHAEIRYEPYIKREEKEAERSRHYQKMVIANDFNYTNLPGLSKELQEKLNRYRPKTIADAALIQGMTPAALSLLIIKVSC